jgi:hypothetical protein
LINRCVQRFLSHLTGHPGILKTPQGKMADRSGASMQAVGGVSILALFGLLLPET